MTLADLAPARAALPPKPPVREDCAGFWRRTGAAAIDAALIITLYVLAVAFAIIVAGGSEAVMEVWPLAVAGAWLYLALGDSSASGATVGKRLARIAVVDRIGRRIGLARATLRFLARLLNLSTAFLGWFLILATERRQALHDLLSGCLVVHAGRAQSHRESP